MYNLYEHSSGLFGQFEPSNLSQLFKESLTCEFDSVDETGMIENANGSTSTGSSYIGSPSSPLSCTSSHPLNSTRTLFKRSLSSYSLHRKEIYTAISDPQISISNLNLGSMRRVSCTFNLDQGVNMPRQHYHHEASPLVNETTSIIIEGMTKPCRYSPTEKKERIERYRSKKSQRNFNKKIQYTCRKTLADSRPRVRGRFARNNELEKSDNSPDTKWSQMTRDVDEDDWIFLLDSISSNIVP
ncbi:hypothetical protein KSS87_011899 [Heliosperma pusillum]|nr:hypothetical protein KSS87_011899 [Heliosperma pusillum]